VINDRFVLYTLSTRRDWLCSSFRLRFYHLACLRFSAELFLFVIFSTFSFALVQLSFIYRLSPRSLRNHYLTLLLFSISSSYSLEWFELDAFQILIRSTDDEISSCASFEYESSRSLFRIASTSEEKQAEH
jgi:hypothetical protein